MSNTSERKRKEGEEETQQEEPRKRKKANKTAEEVEVCPNNIKRVKKNVQAECETDREREDYNGVPHDLFQREKDYWGRGHEDLCVTIKRVKKNVQEERDKEREREEYNRATRDLFQRDKDHWEREEQLYEMSGLPMPLIENSVSIQVERVGEGEERPVLSIDRLSQEKREGDGEGGEGEEEEGEENEWESKKICFNLAKMERMSLESIGVQFKRMPRFDLEEHFLTYIHQQREREKECFNKC